MQSEQQEKIIADLLQYQFAMLEIPNWDESQKQQLVRWLNRQNYKNYRIYRLCDKPHHYVIRLQDAFVPYELEEIYIKERSTLLKLLPLIVASTIIALTVLITSYSKSLMSSVIVMAIPVILGMLFEYFASLKQPKSLARMVKIPGYILLAVMVFGAVVLKEGIICLIILMPFILIFALIGVAIMRMICRFLWRPDYKVYSLALLPMLLLLLLPEWSRTEYQQTQRKMIIHAPQEQVFQAINHIGVIQSQEVPFSPIFLIGFPKPVFGMVENKNNQMIRTIQWQRGIEFKEVVTKLRAPEQLGWTYQFAEDSFPQGSLDDHVKIGGEYFDLLKTNYHLYALDENTTELTLSIDYRLSTQYNWYGKIWANYILNEFSDVVMMIHKQRLEQRK